MLISARQVAGELESIGLGPNEANKVMATGVLGTAVRTRGATLYDDVMLERLLSRTRADEALVDRVCPVGLFIARRPVDVRLPGAEQRRTLQPGWAFSPFTSVWLRAQIMADGSLPLVATVGGVVLCGAEITDVLPGRGGTGHHVDDQGLAVGVPRRGTIRQDAAAEAAPPTGRRAMTDQLVVGAAIVRGERVLAARRTTPPEAAGRWELPGGKVEPGEEPVDALVREVAEELGCVVRVPRWLEGGTTIRPGLRLVVGVAELVAGDPEPTEHDELRWLGAADLDSVDWLDSDRPFLDQLRGLLVSEP